MESMEFNLKMYNAHFCNRAYQDAVQAVWSGQGGRPPALKDYEIGCYLQNAALECCGMTHYAGSVTVAMAIADNAGKDAAIAVLKWLERFATLDHIASLQFGGAE